MNRFKLDKYWQYHDLYGDSVYIYLYHVPCKLITISDSVWGTLPLYCTKCNENLPNKLYNKVLYYKKLASLARLNINI